MVMLAVTTGLRRSELFALKWCDVNFSGLEISICRSIYLGIVGDCKTEASRAPVPITERMAAELWIWKGNNQISPTGRLGVRQPKERGTDTVVAWHCAAESHPACGCTGGHLQKIRLAYLPTYVLDSLDRQWRERQGCTGADAPRKQPLHPSDLQSGTNQDKRAAQSRLVEALLAEGTLDSPPTPVANDDRKGINRSNWSRMEQGRLVLPP